MPGIFGSTYAGVIWKKVMDQLHEGFEPWDWEQPESVNLFCDSIGAGGKVAFLFMLDLQDTGSV